MMNLFAHIFVLLMLSWTVSGDSEQLAEVNNRQERNLFKGYTGYRIRNDSVTFLYFNDLTIAVVEIIDRNLMVNCELIEVFTDEQRDGALDNISRKIRARAIELPFKHMITLMDECDRLDPAPVLQLISARPSSVPIKAAGSESSILSGIVPGTKWCGTGDIANSYFDLGSESKMDRCCRKHDLCPVKVHAYSSRYNLSNKSLYTKSHCECDDRLQKCLKSVNRSAADFMGNIYYNILRVPCIQDHDHGKRFRSSKPY